MHQNKNQNKHGAPKKLVSWDSHTHIPVLLDSVLKVLDPKPGEAFLDVTAGYGGHAGAVLERTLQDDQAVLVDRDQMAVDHLETLFAGRGVQIVHKDFLSAARDLSLQKRTFDVILADLGLSSPHLNTASRGFSFRFDARLDMRMDQRQSLTAEVIINTYDEKELARILSVYGEEPKAKVIAELLVLNRPVTSTQQLVKIVAQASVPAKRVWRGTREVPGYSRVNPATRTFQALRIAVNDELRLVQTALPVFADLLAPGGRLGIITFHSLEDRIVKQYFADIAGDRYDASFRHLTKRPVIPGAHELVSNPRSRSAKLRAVAKINTNKKGDA
ncbi:MAG: 16S rRNA (cytosine(1402)-N(4))-methyltransferase RsmH [Candidatus Saccharimonadales bacterium]